jgi:ribosomal protein L18
MSLSEPSKNKVTTEAQTLEELLAWIDQSIQANEQTAWAAQGAAAALRAVRAMLEKIVSGQDGNAAGS